MSETFIGGAVVGLILAALFLGFRALFQLVRNGVRHGAPNLFGAFVLFGAAAVLAGTLLPSAEPLDGRTSSFLGGCQKGCVADGNQGAVCQPYCECLLSALSKGKSPEEFNELVASAGREGPSESGKEAASAAEACAASLDEMLQPKRPEGSPSSDHGRPEETSG
ncbi:MAG: hypothetical protein GY937_26900 [bacterium]|nr:hypothetical protein [bacterium]